MKARLLGCLGSRGCELVSRPGTPSRLGERWANAILATLFSAKDFELRHLLLCIAFIPSEGIRDFFQHGLKTFYVEDSPQ